MSLFMCRTDFDLELGDAPDGVRVFPSIEDLKKHCPCVTTSCGIVEVRVELVRVWRAGEMKTGETAGHPGN